MFSAFLVLLVLIFMLDLFLLKNYNGACQTTIDQVGNLRKNSDGNAILDLEQLLKQKTFTRCVFSRIFYHWSGFYHSVCLHDYMFAMFRTVRF